MQGSRRFSAEERAGNLDYAGQIILNQTLVIGSTVVDVIIRLPHLPSPGEDININFPLHRLGGCAYNVFETLKFLESPALLCSPVGTGIYGRMVREGLEEQGLKPLVNLEEENGCCYCLIESDGERSFLSCHGAEYHFNRSWMKDLDLPGAGSIYISGIDVEDPTGTEIAEFIYEHPDLAVFFAPGPRIMHIDSQLMEKILDRRGSNGKGPFLHLNEKEACAFSGRNSLEEAAWFLAKATDNALVITLGEKGCYCYDNNEEVPGRFIEGFPVKAVDTTGAGDVHCGVIIAELKLGKSLAEACTSANRIGSAAAGTQGYILKKELIVDDEITAHELGADKVL